METAMKVQYYEHEFVTEMQDVETVPCNALIASYLMHQRENESPLIFHRWAFLTAVGSMLERKVWIQQGDTSIYPNMYCMLVGPSAAKKSTAINGALKIARNNSFHSIYGNGSVTKEKFILDLAHGIDETTTRVEDNVEELLDADPTHTSNCLVAASEAKSFFGVNDAAMITCMTDLWDNPTDVKQNTKKDGIAIAYNPTISVLAATTPKQVCDMFPLDKLGEGILSRMIMVYSHSSGRKKPFPTPIPNDLLQVSYEILQRAVGLGGEYRFSVEAAEAYKEIYHAWKPIRDGRFESYTGRRNTHLLKLALIYAVLDVDGSSEHTRVIDLQHITMANTTLAYTEAAMPDALGEYGGALNSGLTTAIMKVVKAAPKGLTIDDISGAVHTEYSAQKEVIAAIYKLRDAGKIDVVMRPDKNGVLAPKVFAIAQTLDMELPHVDYNLLEEFRLERKKS